MLPSLANLRLGELPPSTPVNAIAEKTIPPEANERHSIDRIVQKSIDMIFPPGLRDFGHVTLIDGANLTYFERAWNANTNSYVKVPQLTDDALTYWRNNNGLGPQNTVIMVMSGTSSRAVTSEREYLHVVLEQVRHIMAPNSAFHMVELALRECLQGEDPAGGQGCLNRSSLAYPKTSGYNDNGTRRLYNDGRTEKRCNYKLSPRIVPAQGDFDRGSFEHYKCEYDDVLFTVFANTLRERLGAANVHTMSMDLSVEKSDIICDSVSQAVTRFGLAATAKHYKYPQADIRALLQDAAQEVTTTHDAEANVVVRLLEDAAQVYGALYQLLARAQADPTAAAGTLPLDVWTAIGDVHRARRGARRALNAMNRYYAREVKPSTPGVHYYRARVQASWWALKLETVLREARGRIAEFVAAIDDQSES